VKPAVLVQDFLGRADIVPIALKDVRAFDEDLTIVVDADRAARYGASDGPDAHVPGQIDRPTSAGLG
jgi:hypothetical protein